MRGRILAAVAFLVVVGAAAGGGAVGKLPLGPVWVVGITAALGLVSTVFSDVVLDSLREQLTRPGQRHRVLAGACLTDARQRLPRVSGFDDPLALGVHPAAEAGYVLRDADPELRAAVSAGGVVVVEGPPRSGKTRAAFEAVRSGAAGRTLVVPRSPGGLLAVVDHAFPLRRSVLWLDRLDEFLGDDGPDRAALHRILAADPRQLLVVATLDSASLRPSPSRAHRLSMLMLRATIVRLPAHWSPAELLRARDGGDPRLLAAIELAERAGTPGAVLAGLIDGDAPRPATRGWPHALPGIAPCVGRESHVATLVAALADGQARPVAVLGGPGMGKTTIIRVALHEPSVAARFGDRRLFVRCDGIADADGLVAEIAAALGLPLGPRMAPAVRAELAAAPALLVLDNLGPTWESDPAGVEELLTGLADQPATTVAVSLRGTVSPPGPAWTTPVHVRRLDHASARAVFLQHAGPAYAKDPYLDEIVAGQDGIPLGVRLMAHTAQGEPDLGVLWRRWHGRQWLRGGTDGYHRMDACIAVSVESNRMNDHALRLLTMLGRLPDGIAESDLDALLTSAGEFASSDLRKLGLAFEDNGRLLALRPIREYVARTRPLSGADLDRLIGHYSELAGRMGAQIGTATGARAAARLVAEAGNIDAVLSSGLERDDPAPAIRGAFGVAEFMRYTGLSRSTLLASAADAAGRCRLTELEAESRYRLGDLALRSCHLEEATEHLRRALDLFALAESRPGIARSVKHLGDVAFEAARYDDAERQFVQAEAEYRGLGDHLGAAHAIKCLGDVAARRGDVPLARGRYRQALTAFEENDQVVGRADCLRRMADVELGAGDLAAADRGYDEAAILYESAGAVLGQANCLLGQARIAAARERWDPAVDTARRAQILYERMSYARGEAATIVLLGDLAVHRGEPAAAAEHFACARSLYRGVADAPGEAQTCERLASVLPEQRAALLEQARALRAGPPAP